MTWLPSLCLFENGQPGDLIIICMLIFATVFLSDPVPESAAKLMIDVLRCSSPYKNSSSESSPEVQYSLRWEMRITNQYTMDLPNHLHENGRRVKRVQHWLQWV